MMEQLENQLSESNAINDEQDQDGITHLETTDLSLPRFPDPNTMLFKLQSQQ